MFALLHVIVLVHTVSLLRSMLLYECDTIRSIVDGHELFLVFSYYNKATVNILVKVLL